MPSDECVCKTNDASESAMNNGSAITDFNKGTWYQSSISGLWYTESDSAGDVAQIRLDGMYYIPTVKPPKKKC